MTARNRPIILALAVIALVVLGVVAFIPLGGKPLPSAAPGATPGSSPIVIGGSPLLDKPAPAIELMALDGNAVSLADYAGRPVVVNFWAPWCIPCREEFPVFVAAREAYAAQGLEILGVVYKDSASAAQAFADDHAAEWPMLADPGEKVYTAYTGFGGVPMTVFIDGGGTVRAVSYGPLSEAGFADQVSTILPEG
jgi:cytochrome c biogenesis protein CcmG, thiol:disulfide interchange protein DsbE